VSRTLRHRLFSAAFITNMFGFGFSVQTGASRIHGELLMLGFKVAQLAGLHHQYVWI
jgi:hypothetical protein